LTCIKDISMVQVTDQADQADQGLAVEICENFGVVWAPGGSGGGTLRWAPGASGVQEGTQVTPGDVVARGAPLLTRFGVPPEQWVGVANRATQLAKEMLRKEAKSGSKDQKARARIEKDLIVKELCDVFKDYVRFQPVTRGHKVLLYRRVIPEFPELPEGFMWETHQVGLDFKRSVASEIFAAVKEGRDAEFEKKAFEVEGRLKELGEIDPDFSAVFSEALTRLAKFSSTYKTILPRNFKLFSWTEGAKFTLDPKIIVRGETPNLDSLFARMSHPREVMAWIGKLFDDTDCKGRQLLWGVSAGNAGQSTLWNAILSLISPVTSALGEVSHVNQFTTAKYAEKRVAMMSDCKNRYMHNSRTVKNLTGGDTVDVENKNEKSHAEAIWCRVLIHSNVYPVVDLSDRSQTTRMLIYELKSLDTDTPDPTMDEKFRREMGHFIWKCIRVEKNLCRGGINIPIPPSMYEIFLRACVTPGERYLRAFIRKNIKYHPKSRGFTEGALWAQYRDSAIKAMDLHANKKDVDATHSEIMGQFRAYLTAHLNKPLTLGDPDSSGVHRYSGGVLFGDEGEVVSPDEFSGEDEEFVTLELIGPRGVEQRKDVPTLQEILSWEIEDEDKELEI
jgi:hypothetical protein